MFSMKRGWFMANNFGLVKDRGHRKGQKRFWPVAVGQNWQKWAGCSSLSLSLPCMRTAVTQCTSPGLHTTLCRKIPAQCTLPLACARTALLCTQCTSPGCPPHCAGVFLLSALSFCHARTHCSAHSALHLAAHHTVQEYSCSVVHQKLFHVFHPLSLLTNLLYAGVYFL